VNVSDFETLARKILHDLPRRAIPFRFTEIVSSPKIKNISLFQKGETVAHLSHPVPFKGRIMIVTIVGRVAMDARNADNERRESVR
jgi:hypothetical protein